MPTCITCLFLTDNGYIEGKELDDFFRHMMKRLGPQVSQLCSSKCSRKKLLNTEQFSACQAQNLYQHFHLNATKAYGALFSICMAPTITQTRGSNRNTHFLNKSLVKRYTGFEPKA